LASASVCGAPVSIERGAVGAYPGAVPRRGRQYGFTGQSTLVMLLPLEGVYRDLWQSKDSDASLCFSS